eukprot:TRINITY_DN19709_c0_g1_i1.p1 TRINITY_DN19709_c0_g1~~TRINITY_DN19709_c0_g1_i1.p1  ORF type:complete len:312 (+),score=56.22 TRINITY_DN19709_c0_g1_i1:59-994(+)
MGNTQTKDELLALRPTNGPFMTFKSESSLLQGVVVGFAHKGLTSLPESIGRLTNVKKLFLNDNNLSYLPSSIGMLQKLTDMSLQRNQISELPDSITRCRLLFRVQIESQGVMYVKKGPLGITSLPCWKNETKPWADMTITYAKALHKLELTKYHEEGLTDVSSSIDRLVGCDHVDFSRNEIANLPENITLLSGLTSLDISHNKLTELPIQLSSLSSLKELNISGNQFTRVPTAVLSLGSLQSLDISTNQITRLPYGLTKLKNLEKLVIVDSERMVFVRVAPRGITDLPCWKSGNSLKDLILDDSESPSVDE